MDRKALREFTHKAEHFLQIDNSNYKQWVFRYTFLELEKDLASRGDITTNTIFPEPRDVKAKVVAKEDGIFAGKAEIQYFLIEADAKFRPGLRGSFKINFFVNDGDSFKSGDTLMEIEADVHDLLAVERVVLNLLMRMSGVATFTQQIVDLVKDYDVLVTPTRKMLWGLLDKRAVVLGGGGTHRINLGDAMLVKDTHLDILGRDLPLLFERISKNQSDCRFVEVEVDSPDEAVEAAGALRISIDSGKLQNIGVLLLDNMSSSLVAESMEKIKAAGLYDGLLFEGSGGINEKNAVDYAKSGVDIISMGCLTNGARSLNMSLKII